MFSRITLSSVACLDLLYSSILSHKLRERLAVRKRAGRKFDGERFNLRKLNELGVKKKYQMEIKNRFAALENLNGDENDNRDWENIKENSKTSAKDNIDLH